MNEADQRILEALREQTDAVKRLTDVVAQGVKMLADSLRHSDEWRASCELHLKSTREMIDATRALNDRNLARVKSLPRLVG